MKTMIKKLLLLAAAAAAFTTAAIAHEKKVPGPNGGRLLTSVSPHVEFLVTADRKVQLTFVDDAGEPIAPAGQSATVISGSRSAPTTLTFSRHGDVLVSDVPLPEGHTVPTIVQLKPRPGAADVIERFNVNLATCSECKHAEYACICGH
jgi:hypothetical protein